MSAISGIWYWDGRPVSDAAIAAMAEASRMAGSDGGGCISPQSGLVLQTQLLHFDRLSAAEHQPWPFVQGSVVTWDGRLDNREDLFVQLARSLDGARSDAAVVAAAYARWGMDSLSKLIGDWSLAIWDASARRLVLACDWMGNRPLYYLVRPHGLAWATCLDALVEAFRLTQEPSEDYIGCRFVDRVPPGLTPFTGAFMLLPGHQLVATAAGVSVSRYWRFRPSTIRYARQEDYDDRLRELLTEAVRVRLRTHYPIWSHLSGGWDSSSVVCLADRLIAQGAVETPRLETLTFKWVNSPECHAQEAPYLEAVEAWVGRPTHFQPFDGNLSMAEVLRGRRRPSGYRRLDLEDPVREAGGRIILTGHLGDGLLLASLFKQYIVLDSLLRGRLFHFLRLVSTSAKRTRSPMYQVLTRMARYGFRRPQSHRRREDIAGVHPTLVARARALDQPQFPSPVSASSAGKHLELLMYGYAIRGTGRSPDTAPELWWTHPYTHRPLVEFALGVPPIVLWEGLDLRPAMRRALQDVLPAEVLGRRTKSDARSAWERSARRLKQEVGDAARGLGLPREWQLVTRGYVDASVLSVAIGDLNSRPEFLKTCVELETWLRTMAAASGHPAHRGDAVMSLNMAQQGAT